MSEDYNNKYSEYNDLLNDSYYLWISDATIHSIIVETINKIDIKDNVSFLEDYISDIIVKSDHEIGEGGHGSVLQLNYGNIMDICVENYYKESKVLATQKVATALTHRVTPLTPDRVTTLTQSSVQLKDIYTQNNGKYVKIRTVIKKYKQIGPLSNSLYSYKDFTEDVDHYAINYVDYDKIKSIKFDKNKLVLSGSYNPLYEVIGLIYLSKMI